MRHGVPGPFEDLSQNVSMHLLWLFDPIQGEDGRRYVVDTRFEPHQPQIVLDIWSHGEERSWNFISIRKIVLGDNRRGLFVVHVHVGVGIFELTQWLDAMVRHDEEISVFVDMLQDTSQHFIERDILVRKGVFPDRVDLRVISRVVRSKS